MKNQVVTINGQKFLIQSVLKLSKKYNLLGFWQTNEGWSEHVHCVELSLEEWAKISPNTTSEN